MKVPISRHLSYTIPSIILLWIGAIYSYSSSVRYSIDGSLNSTFQSAFNSESTTGKSGSFVWDSRLNAKLTLKLSKELLLSNFLKLGYGQINIKPGNSNLWSEPLINSDFINITTSLRSDYCKKYSGFLRLNFKSTFFDQTSRMTLNPFTFNGAAGGTWTYNNDNFSLSIDGSAGISYRNMKRIAETSSSGTISKKFTVNQSCKGNVAFDIDLNYILSQHLYFNSKCQISQSFDRSQKKSFRPPEVMLSLSLNAPVTSYLSFCYNANLEMTHTSKTTLKFNQSLNAGLYFTIKSK